MTLFPCPLKHTSIEIFHSRITPPSDRSRLITRLPILFLTCWPQPAHVPAGHASLRSPLCPFLGFNFLCFLNRNNPEHSRLIPIPCIHLSRSASLRKSFSSIITSSAVIFNMEGKFRGHTILHDEITYYTFSEHH